MSLPNTASVQDKPPAGGYPRVSVLFTRLIIAPPHPFSVLTLPPPVPFLLVVDQINFIKGARPRGPSGLVIWCGIIGATVYGFYQIGRTNAQKRHVTKERREARMAIMPYLQAEQDKMLAEQIAQANAKEAEVMKHVPGWKVGESVYSQPRRWKQPTFGL